MRLAITEMRKSGLLQGLGLALRSRRLPSPVTLMEVCGTHTMAIHRAGIPSILPRGLRLLSGPGCPVCVTPRRYLDTAIAITMEHGVTIATFGDMMRVPGSGNRTLADLRLDGRHVEVVYSPLAALELARAKPAREIVFLAVGFETTAPAIAATLKAARGDRVRNFSVLCAHKLIPPALRALLDDPESMVDGFILPGHVSVVLGHDPYRFIAEEFNLPGVITGFEPADIIQGILMLLSQLDEGRAEVEIQYRRAVRPSGNARARAVLEEVFRPADVEWRGFGLLPMSGLVLAEEYSDLDAETRFPVRIEPAGEPPGCLCGDIVRGKVSPPDCPFFGQACTPDKPIGPCMVSSEGTCAAFYRYPGRDRGGLKGGDTVG